MKKNILVITIIAIGVMSAVVGFATSPCAGKGYYLGNIQQSICASRADNCSVVFWNYLTERTCQYWCCYDANGNSTGALISYCREWVEAGCCVLPSINSIPPGECLPNANGG